MILFFDGVCSLCNNYVDFLIRRDQNKRLMFGSLQGKTASEILPKFYLDLSTIVLVDEGIFYTRSDAIIRSLVALGGRWKVCKALNIFPLILRDAVYQCVATYRYRWFGKKNSCRLPASDEFLRFIN